MLIVANADKWKGGEKNQPPYLYYPEVIASNLLVYLLPVLVLCTFFFFPFSLFGKQSYHALPSILYLAFFMYCYYE